MNGTGTDITGKVVRLRAEYHKPEFRQPRDLLFMATGGFGCSAHTAGTAVIGYYIWDGERCRIEGTSVEAVATEAEIEALEAERASRDAEWGATLPTCLACSTRMQPDDYLGPVVSNPEEPYDGRELWRCSQCGEVQIADVEGR